MWHFQKKNSVRVLILWQSHAIINISALFPKRSSCSRRKYTGCTFNPVLGNNSNSSVCSLIQGLVSSVFHLIQRSQSVFVSGKDSFLGHPFILPFFIWNYRSRSFSVSWNCDRKKEEDCDDYKEKEREWEREDPFPPILQNLFYSLEFVFYLYKRRELNSIALLLYLQVNPSEHFSILSDFQELHELFENKYWQNRQKTITKPDLGIDGTQSHFLINPIVPGRP